MVKLNPKFMKGAVTTAKAVGTVVKPVVKAANYAEGKVADGIIGAAKRSRLTKKTDPGIQNLWTGRREGGGAIALGAVAAGGYMAYSGMKQTTLAPKTGEVSYTGAAPVMNADGVGSNTQAPTLGAGGNMVFGLHNARKG